MTLLRRFTLLAYLLVLLSLVGFTYAAENYGLLFLALILTGLSWWLVEAGNGPVVPRWLINTGVLAAAMMLFYELVIYRQQNLLLALGHFMVGLILCKLFEIKTNRDYGQILILSLLLILSGAILTASPLFGVIVLVYLGLGLYVCLIFHLRCETERAMARHAGADPMTIMPDRQNAMTRDLGRISIGAGVFLFLFASAVFVLFPRTGVPGMLASWRIGQTTEETGFTNVVPLGGSGDLAQSEAIVGKVRLENDGKNIGSEGYQPYFMGDTADVYDPNSRVWVQSSQFNDTTQTYQVTAGQSVPIATPQQYDPKSVITAHFTLYNVPINNNQNQPATLFFPGFNSTAVSISSANTLEVDRLQDGSLTCSKMDGNQIRDGDTISYDVQSAATNDADLVGPKNPDLFPDYVPESDSYPLNFSVPSAPIPPDIIALAQQVAGKNLLNANRTGANAADYNLNLAGRFSSWLSSNYPYTLHMMPVNTKIDPTEDFLLNQKKTGGYCEYFASAMVMMCRGVGVPARIVNGFHGGDFNSVGGYYVIREKFAHAWVQVYAPGRGWVDFDPSPASSLDTSPRRWYSGVSDFFEWLRLQWLQNIITFNEAMRADILQNTFAAVKSFFHTAVNAFLAVENRLQAWFSDPKIGKTLQIGALCVSGLVVAIGLWILHVLRKRKGIVARIVRGMDKKIQRQMGHDLAFLDRLMKLLGLTGLQRQPYQTPMEYVQEVSRTCGTALPEAEQLVNIFYEIRFGGQKVSEHLGQRIREYLAGLNDRLKRRRK
jgi:protein-glutamine gamma-glutamyltransferase